MELEQLQERWNQLDSKLERTLSNQSALLRQAGFREVRWRTDRLALWSVIDLVIGAVALLIVGSFLGDHWWEPSLSIPALGLMIAAILVFIDYVHQLILLSRIAWDGPIAGIQLSVNQLREARIRQFKWIILLSPLLWLSIMTVGSKLIFDVNLIDSVSPLWLASNVLFGLIFIPCGALIARFLRKKWQHGPFWQSVLDAISGHSLAAVHHELKAWREICDESAV